MNKILHALLPPLLATVLFCGVFFLPQHDEMLESSISPDMPLGYNLLGWRGIKMQESEKERSTLAADTRFSKAQYTQLPRVPWEEKKPAVEVSIVYSGQDMNNSIHRPERCLPAQGHMDVRGTESEIILKDGRTLKVTRLVSRVAVPEQPGKRINFIHYYLFVGHHSLCHTHLQRTLQDILDRVVLGQVQRWAYFQAGTCWSPEINVTEEEADKRLRTLIGELLPGQIQWEKL